MAGKPSKNLVPRPALRLGEGHAVDIAIVPGSKGGQVSYNIDTSSLPVPDRRLSSDVVGLVQTDYLMKLLFAQRDVVSEGYLTLLTVQMTFESIRNFLLTMEKLEDGIVELEKSNFPVGKLSEIKGTSHQSAAVSASMILAGYTGIDGCMDFYYTSPFAIHSINFGTKLSVEPIVRVSLPTPLLIAMTRQLRELEPTLPKVFNGGAS